MRSDKGHPCSVPTFCGPPRVHLRRARRRAGLDCASPHFQNQSSPHAVSKGVLEAVDSVEADFVTGSILCAVFFEEDVIIGILECEIFV